MSGADFLNALLGAWLFGQVVAGVFVILQVVALVYVIKVADDIMVFEWDGAEKILWLLVVVVLPFALGALYYEWRRKPQREFIRAALWALNDPRVFGVAPQPLKVATPYSGTSCVTVLTIGGMVLFLFGAVLYLLWFRFSGIALP